MDIPQHVHGNRSIRGLPVHMTATGNNVVVIGGGRYLGLGAAAVAQHHRNTEQQQSPPTDGVVVIGQDLSIEHLSENGDDDATSSTGDSDGTESDDVIESAHDRSDNPSRPQTTTVLVENNSLYDDASFESLSSCTSESSGGDDWNEVDVDAVPYSGIEVISGTNSGVRIERSDLVLTDIET